MTENRRQVYQDTRRADEGDRHKTWMTWMRFARHRRRPFVTISSPMRLTEAAHQSARSIAIESDIRIDITATKRDRVSAYRPHRFCRADSGSKVAPGGSPLRSIRVLVDGSAAGVVIRRSPIPTRSHATRTSGHFRWQRIRSVFSASTPQTSSHSLGCSNHPPFASPQSTAAASTPNPSTASNTAMFATADLRESRSCQASGHRARARRFAE
jgi:hypothetical protein